MTASVSAPANGSAARVEPSEFDLVESTAGWRLTITLTDRLREALARGESSEHLRFAVRVAPNLVPGEPFEAELLIKDPAPRPAPRPAQS